MPKLAVIAVGGNSLILDERHRTVPDQYAATVETCRHIADLIAKGWRVMLTHGNGPQVGFILRRSELARHELHEVPLDYCGADSQGAIGYMFQRALRNEINQRTRAGVWPADLPPVSPVTLITQTLVNADDPAFRNPTKPIGSFMDEQTARTRAEKEGWHVIEDAGRGWRRVVPSPLPQKTIERDAILQLIRDNFFVICSGGGASLAASVEADLFLISTAVERVAINYNKPNQQWLDKLTAAQAREYLMQGHFLKGSMAPKITAVLNFLQAMPKSQAIITDPPNITRAMAGEAGTLVVAA
jgi:carbamate kinase